MMLGEARQPWLRRRHPHTLLVFQPARRCLGELTRCAGSGTPPCYLVAARVATEAASEFTMEAGTGVPTLNESTSASIRGPVMKATLT